MKLHIMSLLIFILMVTGIYPQTSFRFNINNLDLPINNSGVLGDVNIPPGGSGGKYDDEVFLFSGGFYITGYTGDSLWANGVLTASLVKDYQAGIVGSDPAAPENIIYVVAADDPPFGQSWQDWINAVDLGADFYDGDGDDIYNPVDKNNNGIWDPDEDKPDILGDVTAWCVYNDGVPAQQRYWQAEPQGIEVHQTVFAYKSSHPIFGNLDNSIFIRYRIINRGTVSEKLDSVYFTLFSDIDIGAPSDDLAGCDTLLYGSYGYMDTSDVIFGDSPPAIFHHFNQFPHVFIPNETFIDNNSNGIFDPGIDTPLDTAYSYRGPDLGIRIIPGAKNQLYSSSVYSLKNISPNFSDPGTVYHARNYALGRNRGGEILDPCTFNLAGVFGGVDCGQVNPVFWGSGDPVTYSGWLSILKWDMRTISTTGPFELNENEYYDIITAYTLGDGNDPLNSIAVARQNVVRTINAYFSNFGQFPVSVNEDEFVVNDFQLYQNYPNPFNPGTIIRYQIPEAGFVSLIVYDVLGREVAILVDEFRNADNYEVMFDGSGLASGIYFYQLKTSSHIETKKMILIR